MHHLEHVQLELTTGKPPEQGCDVEIKQISTESTHFQMSAYGANSSSE